MPKMCFNYDSGQYEDITYDGFSYTQGEYVSNWDDSDYRKDEEQKEREDEEQKQQDSYYRQHGDEFF